MGIYKLIAHLLDSHLVILSAAAWTLVLAVHKDSIGSWWAGCGMLRLLADFKSWQVVPVGDGYGSKILVVIG